MEPSSVKRRLTCILAADAVGYSKQMGQDEEGTIHVLQAHRAVIDGIIAFHHGRIVSTAGDSVLAEFSSAVEAVRCAVEIQDALKTRNDSLPDHRKMLFRVGVNLGDVVVNNDDLLGDGVNVAARLESMAEPGGICIASSVYDQITGKLDLGFQDIGEQSLKNISRPIHVYRVSGTVPLIRTALLESQPQVASPTSTGPAPHLRGPSRWSIGLATVMAIGAIVAWQGGWVRFGAPNSSGVAAVAVPVLTPPLPVSEKNAFKSADGVLPASAPVPTDANAERLLAEAKAIKRQAEAELARARANAQTSLAVKPKLVTPVESSSAVTPVPAAAVSREVAVVPVAPAVAPRIEIAPEKAPQIQAPILGLFNGRWNVTVTCPKHEDGASGYKLNLVADVRGGTLRGEVGTPGNPDWLLMQGDIRPDGKALLHVKGLTGDPRYAINRMSKGTPYSYQVEALFEGSQGSGRRLQQRACLLKFDKQ